MLNLPLSALLATLIFAPNVFASSGSHDILRSHHRSHARQYSHLDQPKKRTVRRRKVCKAQASASESSSAASATTSAKDVAAAVAVSTSSPETSAAAAEPTKTSTKEEEATSTSSTKKSSSTASSGNADSAEKPSNWPSATQSGPKPTSTVASDSDPYLQELSKAIDNSSNDLYTKKHSGEMTYYGQGLGACGDYYDDTSYTAAVSKLLYDTWPGNDDTSAQNRNPMCGPYVPGRQYIDDTGLFKAASIASTSDGYAQLGGDGLLNCVGASVNPVQCHVPLTATVTHGGKSIVVKIVDRCEGCAIDDIDLTPAAFAAIADMGLGRTDTVWWFNQY